MRKAYSLQRNLVLDGLTDLWYLEATADLLRAAGVADLNDKIALIPANTAGKVVYFATILHAHKLKVAALLDLDAAGDQAAKQETLVSRLGNKRILRTLNSLGWDVEAVAQKQPGRPIADIFASQIADFSKYKLAKAYARWTREHEASELDTKERSQWSTLIGKINVALK